MSSTPRAEGLPPAWASTLGGDGFREFIAVVQRYFGRRDITIEIDPEQGVVRPSIKLFSVSSAFGLQNLLQSCAQNPLHKWQGIIETHFDSILNAPGADNALTVDVTDFARIAPQLRARIYPADVSTYFAELVARPGPPGTLEVLVIDLPNSVRTVAQSEAAAWGVDQAELFAIGRRNLARLHPLESHVVPLPVGPALIFFTGDAFYAASHALLMPQVLPRDLAHGALVGVPRRDVLIIHHITNIGVMDALGTMLHAIHGMHLDGPGSISPKLYWFREGEFIDLPYERAGLTSDFKFSPPAEFAQLMDELEDTAQLS